MATQEINPITGKKGKRYQVNGKRLYEKFLKIYINGRQCVISSLGRIWVRNEYDNVYNEIKPGLSRGWYAVTIHNNTIYTASKVFIHRIVAQYFVPKTVSDAKRERDIAHIKNGVGTDVKPENLMWVNQKEMNRITLFNKDINHMSKLGKVVTSDVANSRYVQMFLVDEDKYTIPEIIKILQLEKYDGIKEALNKKRKELKK